MTCLSPWCPVTVGFKLFNLESQQTQGQAMSLPDVDGNISSKPSLILTTRGLRKLTMLIEGSTEKPHHPFLSPFFLKYHSPIMHFRWLCSPCHQTRPVSSRPFLYLLFTVDCWEKLIHWWLGTQHRPYVDGLYSILKMLSNFWDVWTCWTYHDIHVRFHLSTLFTPLKLILRGSEHN